MTDAPFTSDDIAAGERILAGGWSFVTGAADLAGLPASDRPEVAFAGRSNVGKSSLINALLGRRSLARTSNTPGRTQELNFFAPSDEAFYLVDMPGYGFARAPKAKVAAWTELVRSYLGGRASLRRVFVLIDARHGIKAADEGIMGLLDAAAVSYAAVLTKADKVSAAALERVIMETAQALEAHAAAFPHVLVTSAEKGTGLAELRAALAVVLSWR